MQKERLISPNLFYQAKVCTAFGKFFLPLIPPTEQLYNATSNCSLKLQAIYQICLPFAKCLVAKNLLILCAQKKLRVNIDEIELRAGFDFTKLCFPSKKLPAHRVWQKNSTFYFTTKLSQICELKFAKSVHHLANTYCQKASHLVCKKFECNCW
jgi:hypothetical protein